MTPAEKAFLKALGGADASYVPDEEDPRFVGPLKEEAFPQYPNRLELIEAATKPQTNASFSPAALERAMAAQEVPEVGAMETARNAALSAIPLGNFITNSVGALTNGIAGRRAHLTPKAQAELRAMSEEVPEQREGLSLIDNYRLIRDERRAREEAGIAQHPEAARLGTTAGIGLSIGAPLPGITVAGKGAGTAAKGASAIERLKALATSKAGGRVASGAATGAAYGALGGATDGDADLTRGDVSGTLRDTAGGAVNGLLWGASAGTAAEVARATLPGILRKLAISSGRYNIQGKSDIAAATRKPMRDESVEQVIDDGLMKPWSTTRKTYERIATESEKQGEKLGKLVAELEKRGVKGPEAEVLAQQLMSRYHATRHTNLNDAEAEVFRDAADKLKDRAGPSLQAPKQEQGRLGFQQNERLKSNAQRQARYDRINTTGLDESRQEVASVLRQASEDAVDAWKAEPGRGRGDKIMAGKFKTQKGVTGNYLDALTAAERGASKQVQSSPTGLKDVITMAGMGLDPLSTQVLAAMNGGVMRRVPSTVSATATALRGSLLDGTAGRALAVGGAELGPYAADEARRWADGQDVDDKNLTTAQRAMVRLLRSKKKEK